MKRTAFFFFCVGLSWGQVSGEPTIQMVVEANPREVYIGDPIRFQVALTFSEELSPDPFSPPPAWGNFELRNYHPTPMETNNRGKKVIRHEFELITFSTGNQIIPGTTFYFTLPSGEKAMGLAENTAVHVKSLLAEKGDLGNLMPLKGFFNFVSYAWIAWSLLILLILLGALAFWKWLARRRRLAGGQTDDGPPKSPQERAWEMLEKLEDADLISQGRIKEFYVELSIILRTYLENRFNIQALEKTTSELIAGIWDLNLSLDLSTLLRQFLDDSDLVKFAKFIPEESDIDEDLLKIKRFITQTTPVAREKKVEDVPV